MITKTCSKCEQAKPLDEFHVHPHGKHKRQSRCKACQCAYTKDWYKADPARARDVAKRSKIRIKYGVEVEELDAMFERQGRKCAICRKPVAEKDRHTDHCHKTGKLRGILCITCNVGIGQLGDDPDVLRAAIKYLEAS